MKTMREQLSVVNVGENNELEQLKAQIQALQGELAKAKEPKAPSISFKVTEKGAISVYGLQRFPVTLYAKQWERLLSEDTIKRMHEFVAANAASIVREKPVKTAA